MTTYKAHYELVRALFAAARIKDCLTKGWEIVEMDGGIQFHWDRLVVDSDGHLTLEDDRVVTERMITTFRDIETREAK